MIDAVARRNIDLSFRGKLYKKRDERGRERKRWKHWAKGIGGASFTRKNSKSAWKAARDRNKSDRAAYATERRSICILRREETQRRRRGRTCSEKDARRRLLLRSPPPLLAPARRRVHESSTRFQFRVRTASLRKITIRRRLPRSGAIESRVHSHFFQTSGIFFAQRATRKHAREKTTYNAKPERILVLARYQINCTEREIW